MAVNFTLSEQQAALLIPLLQQIGKTSTGTETSTNIKPCEGRAVLAFNERSYKEVDVTPQSTQEEMPINLSSKLCSSYSASNLLLKKKKNAKSTEAQNCLHIRKLIHAQKTYDLCMLI